MNVFHQVRANLSGIKNVMGWFLVTLMSLAFTVGSFTAVVDTGGAWRTIANFNDPFLAGFGAAYIACWGTMTLVGGSLFRRLLRTTIREFDKLTQEWPSKAAQPKAVPQVNTRGYAWVGPDEANLVYQQAGVKTPENVLLSAFFLMGAASRAVFQIASAEARGVNAEERRAIDLLRDASALLDQQAERARFRRSNPELARN